MAYLVDGIVLAVFALAIWLGYKRGFIKTMAGLVAFLAAAVLALLLSGPVADGLYGAVVEPTVVETVGDQITGNDSLEENIDKALEALPGFVTNTLTNAGIETGEDVLEKLGSGVEDIGVGKQISDTVVKPIVLPLLEAICILLLFIIVYIVATILLRVLNVVAKLPVLKQLNHGLGLASGVVSGVLWVLFLTGLLQVLAAAGTLGDTVTPAVLQDTLITNWVISINPAGSVLQEVMVLVKD